MWWNVSVEVLFITQLAFVFCCSPIRIRLAHHLGKWLDAYEPYVYKAVTVSSWVQ